MKRLNKKLNRWQGLMALAIMIMVCGPTEVLSQQTLQPKDCKLLKKYKGNDRVIDILVDKDGKITVPNDGHIDIWHKDTVKWQITTPSPAKPIKDFEIEFKEHKGCTNDNVPADYEKWPCKEGLFGFGKWSKSKDKEDPDDTISCEIRNKNVLSEYDPEKHHKKGTAKDPMWNYCYVITVNFDDGTYTTFPTETDNPHVNQATGGNGCGGCHASTGF